ncbi:hypothetical protein [Trinickia mobilis]|uniref:hypothetical protein n=1 Tax=Trinickia mobilis TaxID=2816356 RepID=UPI001A8C348E|nr:hypothetical protein [Trinickia mobilis]
MGYLRFLGYGILCAIAIALLIVMCAILKENVVTHGAGQHDQSVGVVIRSSEPAGVTKVSASQ